jgi:hypothetical protein
MVVFVYMMQSNNKKKQKKRDKGYFERAVISNGYYVGAVTSKDTNEGSRFL